MLISSIVKIEKKYVIMHVAFIYLFIYLFIYRTLLLTLCDEEK